MLNAWSTVRGALRVPFVRAGQWPDAACPKMPKGTRRLVSRYSTVPYRHGQRDPVMSAGLIAVIVATAALAGLILRLYPTRRAPRPARNPRPCSDDTRHGAGDVVSFRARIGVDADRRLRTARDFASDRRSMNGTTGRFSWTGPGAKCTLNGNDF